MKDNILMPDMDDVSIIDDIMNTDLSSTDLSKMQAIEQAYVKKFCSLYCLKYKPIKGHPTTFKSKTLAQKHRPWQIPLLDDNHPNIVVQKSRQLGISECEISSAIWFADTHKNTKTVYTFPRGKQLDDFSKSRLDPALRGSKYLSSLLTGENNIAMKKINSSYIIMRSAWSNDKGALAEGVDADVVCFDEYD